MNLWIHLAINVIGTGILASSNFFMQSLVAPTRAEVDAAHASGYWLEIGIQSIRNFRFIKWQKIVYWSLFGLTSVPIHLVFNGAVLESKGTNAALVILGAQDLIEGDWHHQDPIYCLPRKRILIDEEYSLNNSLPSMGRNRERQDAALASTIRGRKNVIESLTSEDTRGNWEKLNFKDCMERYNNPEETLTQYRHVIFVMYDYDDLFLNSTRGWKPRDILKNTTNIADIDDFNPLWGIDEIRRPSRAGESIQRVDVVPFRYANNEVNEAEFDDMNEKWVSNVWNFASTSNIFDPVSGVFITDPTYFKSSHRTLQVNHLLKLRVWRDENPLMTPGDAISSFITSPDEETKDTIRDGKWFQVSRQWKFVSTRRFGNAVPRNIWLITCLVIGSSLIVATAMLIIALLNQSLSESQFGHAPRNTELEWSKYSIKFRALRVTEPKGEQKSTYRLQLPYRFSIPLIIVSTILHWIYSNCMYVSNYITYDIDDTKIFKIGVQYSTKAILIGFCMSLGVTIAPAALAYMRLPGIMVIAGGNSAVISAACHYPAAKIQSQSPATPIPSRQDDSLSVLLLDKHELEELEEVTRKKLKWGKLFGGSGEDSQIGHLGFGTEDSGVEEPVEGEYYSGAQPGMAMQRPLNL
ncbi:hypothetical protein FLONG3_409 [Fusarium longipes]|uniref:DUF6536 domain-containing protein n=1 Tax=Fusarium longipes TaxID=694270 RepID=A0A395T9X6_9HYPO|nr:hypothetical protein FLONG3_409 [Fusarium longipes]